MVNKSGKVKRIGKQMFDLIEEKKERFNISDRQASDLMASFWKNEKLDKIFEPRLKRTLEDKDDWWEV